MFRGVQVLRLLGNTASVHQACAALSQAALSVTAETSTCLRYSNTAQPHAHYSTIPEPQQAVSAATPEISNSILQQACDVVDAIGVAENTAMAAAKSEAWATTRACIDILDWVHVDLGMPW